MTKEIPLPYAVPVRENVKLPSCDRFSYFATEAEAETLRASRLSRGRYDPTHWMPLPDPPA